MLLEKRVRLLVVLLGSALVSLIAASSDSLWIDEGHWAYAAIGEKTDVVNLDPGLRGWQSPKNWVQFSDPAKPLYGIYLWTWEKIFGHSERVLRLSNLPWFLLAQTALWIGLSNLPRLRWMVALCMAISPIVWYYLNETSHYIMLLAGACLVLGLLVRLATSEADLERLEGRHFWWLGSGLLLLCGSNAIGIPWAGTSLVALACLVWGRCKVRWSVAVFVPIGITAVGLLLLAEHYHYWRPTKSGMVTGFGPGNIAFAGYELLGFSGLGPGRLALRENGMPALRPFVPVLVVLGVVIGLLIPVVWKETRRWFVPRWWLSATSYVLLALLLVFVAAHQTHFKLLGRHLMPLEPAIILGLALALTSLLKRPGWGARILALGFCLLWLGSSLSLRFAPRHARDDYRSAAAAANTALKAGKTVWWAADLCGADYYGVALALEPMVPGKAFLSINLDPEKAARLPQPDLVVLSKTDLFDAGGGVQRLLGAGAYRKKYSFPAFTLWEK
jgi:hypothetical protein